MISHAKVTWVEDERPWEIESDAFALYGDKLPLNIDDNDNNPFGSTLKNLRKVCKGEAKD
jgi:hypothetical protein